MADIPVIPAEADVVAAVDPLVPAPVVPPVVAPAPVAPVVTAPVVAPLAAQAPAQDPGPAPIQAVPEAADAQPVSVLFRCLYFVTSLHVLAVLLLLRANWFALFMVLSLANVFPLFYAPLFMNEYVYAVL